MPEASGLNPLSTDDTVHMNGADEVLFPLPGLLQDTGTHIPQKAPSHSVNVAGPTARPRYRPNKYKALTRKPVTRVTGSLASVPDKDRHTGSLSQTPSRTIVPASCATCVHLCTHWTRGAALPLCHLTCKLGGVDEISKRSKSPVGAQLPTLPLEGKDSAAQPYSPDSESPSTRTGPGEGTRSFQIRKEKDSKIGQQTRLTLPTVRVSNVPSRNCLFFPDGFLRTGSSRTNSFRAS